MPLQASTIDERGLIAVTSYVHVNKVEYKGQFTIFFADTKSIPEVIGFLFSVCGSDCFFVSCIGGY